MSEAKMNIDKLIISLHGVSAIIAEEALSGLAGELRRRFNEFQLQDLVLRDLNNLSLSPIRVESVLDAGTLRGIIADRLIESITHARQEPEDGNASANNNANERDE